MIWHDLILGPWIVFCVFWAASALKTRKTVSQESFASRCLFLFLSISGFVLLFSHKADIGFLGHRIIPRSYFLGIAGVALTWIGIAIALWARWNLGQYWSGRVTLKEDHQLIRSGPYSRLRHPIYSGIILAALGGALAIGRWRCILGIGLIVLGYWMKARKEESFLAAQFGAGFKEHCQNTGFLLPKLW